MKTSTQINITWTDFYVKFADKLLTYKGKREALLPLLEAAHKQAGLKYPFIEDNQPLTDICPFTVFGAFNKGIKTGNRILLIKALIELFDVQAPVPSSFDGIPVVNNMLAWFFAGKNDRNPDDIDNLWNVFEAAILLADNPVETNRNTFKECYNTVIKQLCVKWNITMGLYWMRPYYYLNLDKKNRQFLLENDEFRSIGIKTFSDLIHLPDAENYLKIVEMCQKCFSEKKTSFQNFPELSQAAWVTTTTTVEKSPGSEPVKGKRFWMYAPGKNARKWEEYYSQSIMGIGWDNFGDLGDLSLYSTKEEILAKMKELSGDLTTSYRNDLLALWQFSHEMRIGDIIFVKKGMFKIIGRGVVESEYMHIPERDEHKHIRKVKWTHSGDWEAPKQVALKTLTDISSYTDTVQKLELLFAGDGDDITDDPKEPTYELYSEEDFLDEVFMGPKQYEILVSLLKNKKNLVLQGAPGVGKTFIAKRLAYSMIDEKDTSRVTMVQFHQSYSYEDFIMGFRPVKDGFELTPGPFYEFCKTAQDDDRDYFFIIDEINRGNLSKIFGELLMLIENDKRGEKLRLLYANELFSVPDNVHIIGLMNTADRSLAMIDYALRRRFAFYNIEPAFDSAGFQDLVDASSNGKFATLIKRVKELNEVIASDESLGDGFRIGHSYFCTKKEITDDWLETVVKFELLPMLNEYWFDEKSKREDWGKRLCDALND